jgi:glycosyltransferase involved in cell wall biosynthesis
LIFVPSQFWKDKLAADFNVNAEKILVTPEATDDVYFNQEGKMEKTYDLQPPYLIYTGSVYPHKNIKIVFEALQELPEIQLGIACSRNVFTDRVEKTAIEMGLENQVSFLGFVPDMDLKKLYQKAIALVQPSLMEGFGLTGLEAMSAGVPVIAANSSCLPEVYGKGALYFNPNDKSELIKRINDLINDKNLRQRMIKQGTKQVKKFSWKKTAELTFEGYQKALK